MVPAIGSNLGDMSGASLFDSSTTDSFGISVKYFSMDSPWYARFPRKRIEVTTGKKKNNIRERRRNPNVGHPLNGKSQLSTDELLSHNSRKFEKNCYIPETSAYHVGQRYFS